MVNNSYMSVWLLAMPTTSDSSSQNYRYIWVQGQANNTALETERSLTVSSLNLSDLPINISTSSYNGASQPDITVSLVSFNSSDDAQTSENFNLYKLDIVFEGSHDWKNDSIQPISIKFKLNESNQSFKKIFYSPSMLENETKMLLRDQFNYDPVYIFLPLTNGMMFIPKDLSGSVGVAIVKNVTKRHTSWLWEKEYVKVLETEGIHLDAHHQFYIIDNIDLQSALKFANRINVFPPWIISKNVSLIQGNEVYDEYDQMMNIYP